MFNFRKARHWKKNQPRRQSKQFNRTSTERDNFLKQRISTFFWRHNLFIWHVPGAFMRQHPKVSKNINTTSSERMSLVWSLVFEKKIKNLARLFGWSTEKVTARATIIVKHKERSQTQS